MSDTSTDFARYINILRSQGHGRASLERAQSRERVTSTLTENTKTYAPYIPDFIIEKVVVNAKSRELKFSSPKGSK